jgi:cobalt-precorrin 5A hydrolase
MVESLKVFVGYKEENFVFVTPDDLEAFCGELPSVYITPQKLSNTALQIHPQKISLGLGMNRGTPKEEIKNAVKRFCYEHGLEFSQVNTLASFSAKNDEEGLLAFAKESALALEFYDEEAINALTQNFSPSQATKFFNIKGVAEPAALLASEHKTLFLSKRIYGAVTVAAAF